MVRLNLTPVKQVQECTLNMEERNIHYLGPNNSNNEAEYHGLFKGLESILTEDTYKDVKDITIYGDSMLVIQHISGNWAVKAVNLLPLKVKCSQYVSKIKNKYGAMIKFEHVERALNSNADSLSNLAIVEKTSRKL